MIATYRENNLSLNRIVIIDDLSSLRVAVVRQLPTVGLPASRRMNPIMSHMRNSGMLKYCISISVSDLAYLIIK